VEVLKLQELLQIRSGMTCFSISCLLGSINLILGAWRLTLVNNNVVNAASTAGGKIYVHGGMLPLLGQNKGLWAAVLSHETAHTGRRHQVILYQRKVYNQQ
jgi:predicted Zn-dependent protease